MGPFQGKTYSLYNDSQANTTDDYFRIIKKLADSFLQDYQGDEKKFLSQLRKAGKNKSIIKKLHTSLSVYTKNVKKHLKTLSLFGRFDKTLRTSEDQYHWYMLEIELVNRIYKNLFKK